jgi:hypothetical protein
MRDWKAILFLVLAPALLHTASAQVKSGTAGAQFLKLSATARGLGMADALLPLADDVSAIYYNPGGLTQLDEGWHASMTHYALPVDVTQNWVGIAYGQPDNGTSYGLSLTFLNSGWMDETTPERPEGTGRQFNYLDFALGATVAKRLTNKFSTGLTLKMINESSMEFDATGWAADVGTFYDTKWRSMKLAMIISNFGPDMKFIEKEYPLPILFKFGVSMDLMGTKDDEHYMQGAFEFGHPSDNVEQLNLGLEYSFKDQFFLRLGKKVNAIDQTEFDDYDPETGYEYPLLSTDGLSLGAGFNWKHEAWGNMTLDYAYAPSRYLDSRNMITLSWSR